MYSDFSIRFTWDTREEVRELKRQGKEIINIEPAEKNTKLGRILYK